MAQEYEGLLLLKKKFNELEKNQMIIVLYENQVYRVNKVLPGVSTIDIIPLSSIDSISGRKSINRNSSGFYSVLDQAITNDPFPFKIVKIPTPRYDTQDYYMLQIDSQLIEESENR